MIESDKSRDEVSGFEARISVPVKIPTENRDKVSGLGTGEMTRSRIPPNVAAQREPERPVWQRGLDCQSGRTSGVVIEALPSSRGCGKSSEPPPLPVESWYFLHLDVHL